MYGRGRGRGGYGLGIQAATPAGYTYVGPCRCGFGPHAYYLNAQGQVVPATTAWAWPVQAAQPGEPAPRPSEIEQLRAEKAELERRLSELEERLQGRGQQ